MLKHGPWLLAGLLIVLLVGCAMPTTTGETAPDQTIMVFAGAGLKDALTEVTDLYRQSHSKTKVSFNFAGAGTLQRQVEQGAPADLIIFPGEKQMDALEKSVLIDKTSRKKIVTDCLVLITPEDKEIVRDFADLASADIDRVAIGDPGIVPAGESAKTTLVNLGLWDKVRPKLLLAKDVSQVCTYVETGNVDAGLVWRSTAASSPKVRIAAEGSAEVFIIGAVVGGSKHKETALSYLNYLTGPEATEVFARYGYTPMATAL